MAFTGFNLPDIQNADLSSDKERRKILEYLYQLTEQLRFVLTNIDEDNLSSDLKETIESSASASNLTSRVEDAEKRLSSVRKQTAEGFAQTVTKDSVISAINQTAEIIQISAAKLALEGYVSINGTFSVDEDGYLHCNGGTIGGWNIVPNMILGGPTSEINSGKIVGTSMYATSIFGSNGIYMGYNQSTGIQDLSAPYLASDGMYSAKFSCGSTQSSTRLTNGTYQMYQDEGDKMYSDASLLQGLDESDYSRYRDTVSDYYNDLNYYYNKFNDMSEAEYNRYLNDLSSWESDRNYWYAKTQDEQTQSNWQAEYDLAQQSATSSGSKGTGSKGTDLSYENLVKLADKYALTYDLLDAANAAGKLTSYQYYMLKTRVDAIEAMANPNGTADDGSTGNNTGSTGNTASANPATSSAVQSFKQGLMSESKFFSMRYADTLGFSSYKDYVESMIEAAFSGGKLTESEANYLMDQYGL